MTHPSRPPKLPVWRTIWWSYEFAFRNLGLLYKTGWIVPVAFTFAVFVHGIGIFATMPDSSDHPFLSATFNLIALAIVATAIGRFAVRWHRMILLKETHDAIGRFSRRELSYIGQIALMFLIWSPGTVIVVLFNINLFVDQSSISKLLEAYEFVVWLVLPVLVSLRLPALSVDDRAIGLFATWSLLKGNRLHFIVMGFIVGMSVEVCSWLAIGVARHLSAHALVPAVNFLSPKISSNWDQWMFYVLHLLSESPGILLVYFAALIPISVAVAALTFTYAQVRIDAVPASRVGQAAVATVGNGI